MSIEIGTRVFVVGRDRPWEFTRGSLDEREVHR
jgi:hypothetical protein